MPLPPCVAWPQDRVRRAVGICSDKPCRHSEALTFCTFLLHALTPWKSTLYTVETPSQPSASVPCFVPSGGKGRFPLMGDELKHLTCRGKPVCSQPSLTPLPFPPPLDSTSFSSLHEDFATFPSASAVLRAAIGGHGLSLLPKTLPCCLLFEDTWGRILKSWDKKPTKIQSGRACSDV